MRFLRILRVIGLLLALLTFSSLWILLPLFLFSLPWIILFFGGIIAVNLILMMVIWMAKLFVFLFIIFYMLHVHISCVLFFYFINPNNDWYKENYCELRRIFIKLRLIK